MLIDAGPELMTELVPTSDSVRRRLPRWDPRLWSGHERLQMAKTRSGADLRRLGLTWGRARAQKASSSRPPADPARNDATPPCRAQQAPAVDRRPSPALASTALGGVGGPQAAVLPVTVVTPRSDAAEDRRRWASPGYLSANGMRLGRLHYEPPARGEPQLAETPSQNHAPNLHVLLNLPDHLGSSSIILDHATGELVEARTHQPYGATESDYRPERWKGFREDYGFTGKEEDIEVGLQYFGKRYLSPYLGRWISADPLTIHALGGDLNLYAYVSGHVLKATDPVGLETDENGVRVGATTVHTVEVGADGEVSYTFKESSTAAKTIAAPAAWAPPNLIAGTVDEKGALDTAAPEREAQPLAPVPDGLEEGIVNALAQTATEPVLGLLRNLTDKPPGDYSPVRPFPNGDDVLGNVFVTGLTLGVGFASAGERLALQAPKLQLRSFCFAEGTEVLMADGSTKPIEEVQEGDEVLADEPQDAAGAEPRKVTQIHRTATYRLFHVGVGEANGGEIVATGSHPFWTQRGWVTTEDLTLNDVLSDDRGRSVAIHAIAVESRDAPTFNLSVEGAHTFFVVAGNTPILVHNIDPWDVAFSRSVSGPQEVFQHGPWAGSTLGEAIGEARTLGRLPPGLELNAARYFTPAGEEVIAAINNRTLYVAQEAGVPVNPVNNIDSAKAFGALEKQLALASQKGGSGTPFLRCP